MTTERSHTHDSIGGPGDTFAVRRENRLRSQARRHGLGVRKSRAGLSMDNHGGYQIIDVSRNSIVLGERFDLDLDAVEDYLSGAEA